MCLCTFFSYSDRFSTNTAQDVYTRAYHKLVRPFLCHTVSRYFNHRHSRKKSTKLNIRILGER